MSKSYSSWLKQIAREAAKNERQAMQQGKREELAHLKLEKERQRLRAVAEKQSEKERQERYLESRHRETEDLNQELMEFNRQLQGILEHTFSVNDAINFDSLRVVDTFPKFVPPQYLTIPASEPKKDMYIGDIKPPTIMEKALGMGGRYKRELASAEELYEKARQKYRQLEDERIAKLHELRTKYEAEKKTHETNIAQRNSQVDDLQRDYVNGEVSAVVTYNAMVLERSLYPDGFPQQFRLAYKPDSKELIIEYELPRISIIPIVSEYEYVKSKDTVKEKPCKPAAVKLLYQDVIAGLTLRTIHEVFEADQGNHLELVVFNGFVRSVDPATGKDIQPHLISVRVSKERFQDLDLARVDKRTCLRNLGAQVSPQPDSLQPIKPVVEFNMVDRRFIDTPDVLSDIESRPNLMDLSPTEFEALISNLFQKNGLETRLTQASRDGGVDVVAYDLRPVTGGKVVIQAKRYKNTVGVSAVRDLYGTVMNEGANKGILVTTSSYGKDAYEFAKDKPLELIDGGGVLYLLEQIGVQCRIIMPAE